MPFSIKAEPMSVTVVSYLPNGYSPALHVFKGNYKKNYLNNMEHIEINHINFDSKIIITRGLSTATK